MSGVSSLTVKSFEQFLTSHLNLEELFICPLSIPENPIVSKVGSLSKLHSLQIGFIHSNDLSMQPLALCTTLQNLHIQVCLNGIWIIAIN